MQAIGDIFKVFGTVNQMARDVGRKYDTVLAWRIRGRIPEDSWGEVIAGAAKHGITITVAQLLEFNAPMKKRGKPPKFNRRKRIEARAG